MQSGIALNEMNNILVRKEKSIALMSNATNIVTNFDQPLELVIGLLINKQTKIPIDGNSWL